MATNKNKEHHYCTVCQCYGQHEPIRKNDMFEETVYDERGFPVYTTLCRYHAVELFRLGQKKFFVKHFSKAKDIIADDFRNTRFYNLMDRVGHKFRDLYDIFIYD